MCTCARVAMLARVDLSSDDDIPEPVAYAHLRAHETGRNLVCRILPEQKLVKAA